MFLKIKRVEQDLSPDMIARLIFYILFLKNSVRDLNFDTCGGVGVGGGGGGGRGGVGWAVDCTVQPKDESNR